MVHVHHGYRADIANTRVLASSPCLNLSNVLFKFYFPPRKPCTSTAMAVPAVPVALALAQRIFEIHLQQLTTYIVHRIVHIDSINLSKLLTSMSSTSERNLVLTEVRASSGHSWNQSILVQLTMAGNFRLRIRSVEPTGEKHSTT